MIHKDKEYNQGNFLLNDYNNLDYLLNLFLLHLRLAKTLFLYFFFKLLFFYIDLAFHIIVMF